MTTPPKTPRRGVNVARWLFARVVENEKVRGDNARGMVADLLNRSIWSVEEVLRSRQALRLSPEERQSLLRLPYGMTEELLSRLETGEADEKEVGRGFTKTALPPASRRYRAVKRNCLRCDGAFISEWSGNRLCESCNRSIQTVKPRTGGGGEAYELG